MGLNLCRVDGDWLENNPAFLRINDVDGTVLLSVEDAGPGVAPAHLAQLFDRYFTTKKPGEGTGLGLA